MVWFYIRASGEAHAIMFPRVANAALAAAIDGSCPHEPHGDPDRAPAASVGDENRALAQFVDALESLDADQVAAESPPLDRWIDDWRALLIQRERYLERLELADNAPRPRMPSVDGYSVEVRMQEYSGIECAPAEWILDDFDRAGLITSRGEEASVQRAMALPVP